MNAAEQIDIPPQHIVMLQPGEWVLESIIKQIFGLTKDQLFIYRKSGLMLEGIHYMKNHANRYTYCVAEINKWMAGK